MPIKLKQPMMEETTISQSEQSTLSIRLSAECFAYSVFRPSEDPAVTCCGYATNETLSLTANLKRMFREVESLRLPYRRVNVLMAGPRVTLMPLELFEDEQAESVFYYNFRPMENERVHYNILRQSNMVILFGMESSTCTFLADQHPSVRFYAQFTPLIEHFTTLSRQGDRRRMYLHLGPAEIEVCVYECGRLQAANVFPCRAMSDQLYYALSVWQLQHMDRERDELHLVGGSPDKREALQTQLKRYIRQVTVPVPADHLDLQTIALCE